MGLVMLNDLFIDDLLYHFVGNRSLLQLNHLRSLESNFRKGFLFIRFDFMSLQG